MGVEVLGRKAELAAIEWFLDAAGREPAGLILEGESGLGKTTLWTAAGDAAAGAGRRVLSARGAEAEARMGYAALAELLAEVEPGPIAALPEPQRDALATALLRSGPAGGGSPDRRAVATGFVSLLERLAAERPLVIALDDFQWLDASSAEAIRFAARRFRGPIGILAAQREGEGFALRDPEHLRRQPLDPLPAAEIRRLVGEGSGRRLTPATLDQIDRTAAGNPFVALELARAAERDGGLDTTGLPESLRELVDSRLAGLGPEVREALLLAAALAQPRVDWIASALGDGDAPALLDRAEGAGVVVIEPGRVRFAHPLLASGVYAGATGAARRETHRRLAAVVDDPEERARHLGLAGDGSEAEVIAALGDGAAAASARGAPADAAQLLELALALGAGDSALKVDAAAQHFAAGDSGRARALLEEAIAELRPGPARARALAVLGTIRCRDEGYAEGAALLERALTETDQGAALVELTLELAYVLANAGRIADALAVVNGAVDDAAATGDEGLLAEALAVTTIVGFLAGHGLDQTALARARQLEDPERRTFFQSRPSLVAAILLFWVGELEESQRTFEGVLTRCAERGEESELVLASRHTANLACLRGDLGRAQAIVAAGLERAWQLDSRMARALALADQAAVAGWEGEAEVARAAAGEALGLFQELGSFAGALVAVGALGTLAQALGEAEVAADLLAEPAGATVGEVGDPAVVPFMADAVEALVGAGRAAEAEPLAQWYEERAAALGRPALEALARRCRGLLLAAHGEVAEAEEEIGRALAAHDRFPLAFDRARTLLALGQVRRRLRRRRDARVALEEARAIFEQLGAALWAKRAVAELERLGLRRGPGDELTPNERRVAELAAEGMTNRAVAAALFVSPKTVEANLARAYRKLGISSRAELGRRMAEIEAPPKS